MRILIDNILDLYYTYQATEYPERNRKGIHMPTARKKTRSARAAGPLPKVKQTAIEKEMAVYGITRVPVDYFHFGSYRYTNLNDALAQARKTNQS
jgi:hypothetical protein